MYALITQAVRSYIIDYGVPLIERWYRPKTGRGDGVSVQYQCGKASEEP
jgi:hypothetical protein